MGQDMTRIDDTFARLRAEGGNAGDIADEAGALDAVVIVVLIRRHRIGFLVDVAILGFAVGCGFKAYQLMIGERRR